MDIVKFVDPSGPEWELLVAVAVIIVAPVIVERLRLPGMVGLLFGGMAIGPNVLGVVSSTEGVVAELGSIGLLYLMSWPGSISTSTCSPRCAGKLAPSRS